MGHLHWDSLQWQHLAWWSHLLLGQACVIQAEILAIALREAKQKVFRELHALGMDPMSTFTPGAVDHGRSGELSRVVGLPGVGVHLTGEAALDPIACLRFILLIFLIVGGALSIAAVLQLVRLSAKVELLRVFQRCRVLKVSGLLAASLSRCFSILFLLEVYLVEMVSFWWGWASF